jgi:hypothetical protein
LSTVTYAQQAVSAIYLNLLQFIVLPVKGGAEADSVIVSLIRSKLNLLQYIVLVLRGEQRRIRCLQAISAIYLNLLQYIVLPVKGGPEADSGWGLIAYSLQLLASSPLKIHYIQP